MKESHHSEFETQADGTFARVSLLIETDDPVIREAAENLVREATEQIEAFVWDCEAAEKLEDLYKARDLIDQEIEWVEAGEEIEESVGLDEPIGDFDGEPVYVTEIEADGTIHLTTKFAPSTQEDSLEGFGSDETEDKSFGPTEEGPENV